VVRFLERKLCHFFILLGVLGTLFSPFAEAARVHSVKGYLVQLLLSSSEQKLNLKSGYQITLVVDFDEEYSCRINQMRSYRIQVDCEDQPDFKVGSSVEVKKSWTKTSKSLPSWYAMVGAQYLLGQFQYTVFNLSQKDSAQGVTIPLLRVASRFETPAYFGFSVAFGNIQNSKENQITQTLISCYVEYPLQFFKFGLQYIFSAQWTDSEAKGGNGFALTSTYDLGRGFHLLADYYSMNIKRYQGIQLFSLGLGYQF
jgi:hypothetical protein